MAVGREPGGPAADHRTLPQRYRTTGLRNGTAQWGAGVEGARKRGRGAKPRNGEREKGPGEGSVAWGARPRDDAARWGHRALPQRDRTTGPVNGNGRTGPHHGTGQWEWANGTGQQGTATDDAERRRV